MEFLLQFIAADFIFHRLGDYHLLQCWPGFTGAKKVFGRSTKGKPRSCCNHFQRLFGLFYGVLVAFVVFVTWSGYDEARKNLQMEASEALDIFHTAEAFPDSPKKIIQQGVKDYLAAVYNDEVPKMAEGDLELYSGGAHATLKSRSLKWTRPRFPTGSCTVNRYDV